MASFVFGIALGMAVSAAAILLCEALDRKATERRVDLMRKFNEAAENSSSAAGGITWIKP